MTDLIEPGLFDEDYLYFYAPRLEERSDAETDVIVRLARLEPGMEVLDAPCGHGRIANRIAARGMRVTGLDATPLFLEVARKDAAERGVDVEYVEGDLRAIPWEGRFDALVNWFTSFGYYDDETNRAILSGFHRALKPGGRLLIEHMNRERVVRLQADPMVRTMAVLVERGDDLEVDKVSFDVATGRTNTERIGVRGGKVRRSHFAVRVFTFTELRGWLLDAGFSKVEGFAGDASPLELSSERMILVATV